MIHLILIALACLGILGLAAAAYPLACAGFAVVAVVNAFLLSKHISNTAPEDES